MRRRIASLLGLAAVALLTVYAWQRMAPPPAPEVPPDVPLPGRADRVVIDKAARELRLYAEGRVLRRYRVALGGNPAGPKREEGDRRTPEGTYRIDAANPNSAYHLSLRISYPNAADRAAARARGVSPGGDIMIHGLPNRYASLGAGHRLYDWTNGCIAVTNAEMDEIWRLVAVGTPVEINP
jgi:murein L,D-transpeptidase YafK